MLQPIAKKLNFTIKDGANFQESTFKFIVYLSMYVASSVILFSRYSELLSNPEAPWTGMYDPTLRGHQLLIFVFFQRQLAFMGGGGLTLRLLRK